MSRNAPPGPGPTKQEPALSEKLATPKAFAGIIITIAAVWFIIANNSRVRIHVWLTWVDARLWVVLLLTFVAGALVGYLFARRRHKAAAAKEKQ